MEGLCLGGAIGYNLCRQTGLRPELRISRLGVATTYNDQQGKGSLCGQRNTGTRVKHERIGAHIYRFTWSQGYFSSSSAVFWS